ncbi:hypothetical protein NKY66_00085 [Sinorhizobium meliloti]|uniref:hypothetical protein n=1 Tax=Rhizobium meliloti TaxID=382 RepID=UPI000FDAF443|nr:hypothetical protein [Sinorhizobium meliloti]MDW9417110.1 hypothetical protein [Sinorhizobium meliloti]MDW9480455.1 hypothetical protein [Sinorhizobium meliloti]MDW9513933.1 hypothetical protein [Sinorhizobium meliloti]MQW10082.1 hypothetical protein [Sinorhizobium meliloti]RVG74257.1 hypothetical protein CN220_05685 [Sinorhizobium meliloti]
MPMPEDTPTVFVDILADYRHGTINADAVRSRIGDVIKADPSLQPFKDEHLRWTDYDDAVEWV